MPHDIHHTDDYRAARFTHCDLSGVEIRDSDVTGLRIVDSFVTDVSVSGELSRVIVNDVDVTDYVEGELDRAYPERVPARTAATPEDFRRVWPIITQRWEETLSRARLLPEEALHRNVAGEWSFVQTLRHLLFATDAWVGRSVLGLERPYHRLGLPSSNFPESDAAALGLELDARPGLAEVLEARSARQALVADAIAAQTDATIDVDGGRLPAPGYPTQEYTPARCLRVVAVEECEHRRYAERDLAVLEADGGR